MARSRNIKPGFFLNDEMAELDPLARLLFIGLWTIADFNGRFEYRPKKIKAEVLPYDNCDIEKLMINLDKSGFITIYNVEENTYVEIVNFTKHQNPHPNERKKGTDIPKPTQAVDSKRVTINHDLSRLNHDQNVTDHADSLILIPDSCIGEKTEKTEKNTKTTKFIPPTAEQVREYLEEKNITGIDPQKFIDHYEANGWYRGKTKIKSWKACVRTWASNAKTEQRPRKVLTK